MSLSIESLTSEQLARMAELRRLVETQTMVLEDARKAVAMAHEQYNDFLVSLGYVRGSNHMHEKGVKTKQERIEQDAREKGLLTAQQAAKSLGVSPAALSKAVIDKRLAVAVPGRQGGYPNLYHPEEIERYRAHRATAPQRISEARKRVIARQRAEAEPPVVHAPAPKVVTMASTIPGIPEGWIPTTEAADRMGVMTVQFLKDHKEGLMPEIPAPVSGHWCPEGIQAALESKLGARKGSERRAA